MGPPDPASGEAPDGRVDSSRSDALLAPKVLLFPVRLLFLGLEPPARWLTEFEARHHLYQHFYDLSTSSDGLIGIRPELNYTVSFKPSFGGRFYDNRAMGYETSLSILAMGGPDVARGEIIARPIPFSSPVQLTLGALYDRRNDRLFAGIANTAPVPFGQLGAARYQSDNLDTDAVLGFRLAAPLILSFGGAFGWRQFANGEAYSGDPSIEQVYCQRRSDGTCIANTINSTLVPGFIEGTRFLRTSAGLTLDLRDSATHSSLGLLVALGADYTHGIAGGDDSSYFRLHGAATLPFNLWAHRNVLLFRAATQILAPLGSFPVPFSELPTLGGPNDLRGFREQLFHGYTSFIATAEYRFPVWMWMDADLFFDYGGVFDKWYGGFGASRMQPDLGLGLRLFSGDQFWLRVQLAYGWGEGWRFSISTVSWP